MDFLKQNIGVRTGYPGGMQLRSLQEVREAHIYRRDYSDLEDSHFFRSSETDLFGLKFKLRKVLT